MKRIFRYATSGACGTNGLDPSDIETHVNVMLTTSGHRLFVSAGVFRVLGGDVFATPILTSNGTTGYRVFIPKIGGEVFWNEVIQELISRGYIKITEVQKTIKVRI